MNWFSNVSNAIFGGGDTKKDEPAPVQMQAASELPAGSTPEQQDASSMAAQRLARRQRSLLSRGAAGVATSGLGVTSSAMTNKKKALGG
jgi:hypothetical protein